MKRPASRISILRTLLLIGLFSSALSGLQAQVVDTFSDGDFTSDPAWEGDISSWEVTTGFELHLNAPAVTDEAHLSTPSEAISDGVWEFRLRMEFNPSADNKAYIYLSSDQADLESALQGYFVMVGNTADEISLYRQDGGNTVKIIDGLDDSVDLSLVETSIRVTRDASGNWELFTDVGNFGTFFSEGSTFDDTYSSSAFFGFRCDYTSTRSDLFFFDDVNVTGSGFMDSTPPAIENVTVLNSTTLRILFTEEVEPLSATSPDSYEWNGNIPSTVTIQTDTVWLEFSSEFPVNISQILSISGVADLNENIMAPTEVEFIFLSFGQGTLGSVVFNEFMADPTPVIGLPDAEYIELFNASDSAFDLLGWNLSNSGDQEILTSHILNPGEYVIICDDAFQTIFSAIGDVLVVTSLTALSNTGDDLQLFNAEGTLLDAISYTTDWYGGAPFNEGGYALERANPFLPCSSSLNWSSSSDFLGGTPGAQNSNFIQEDTDAPFIANVSNLSPASLTLEFNEVMDDLSLILGSYVLDPLASLVPTASPEVDAVTLTIAPSLSPGASYQLTISDLQDCSGNTMSDTTLTLVLPDVPETGDIIFNEIMADPSPPLGLPEFEYLELFNPSDKILDLQGWTLVNTTTDMVLNGFLMLPGSYVILCDEEAAPDLASFGDVLAIPSFSTLSNTGDDLYLFDNTGELIDEVVYTLAWYNDPSKDDGGYSIERINPELPCSGSSNWAASNAALGGSPGQENANLDLSPDAQSPEAITAFLVGPTSLLIQFNEIIEAGSVTEENFTLTPAVDIISVDVNGPSSILLGLSLPLDTGILYSLTVNGVADCSGNVMAVQQTFSIALPELAQPGDLILNEILFNPRTGGSDFVELYNRSSRAISLKNWKLSNIDANGVLENVDIITLEDRILLPGDFVFLTEDVQNIIFNYPLTAQGAALEMADLPSLSDDEGNIILVTPDVEIHDAFYYSDDYHFALIDDLNGVSLERVDYNRLTNDPTNWHSAAENVGWATPGYENSQLQPSNNTGQSFSVEPKVFSPDNDGFEDLLNINYALDRPGQLANITIFDREGRAVRLLARNQLLGTTGTISWNGINEDGNKARIGVYIIFIEVLDLDGSISSTKKTCVLGGPF